MSQDALYRALLLLPPLLFSLSFHEAAHAWMAKRCGDDTAEKLGRLTLNPFAHLELVGSVIFPMIMLVTANMLFGWAKPVPVNPQNLKNFRRDDLMISLAGPVSNLILAVVFAIGLRMLSGAGGALQAVESTGFQVGGPLAQMLLMGVVLNVALALFNMLPIPPLDGSHVLAGLLPERHAQKIDQLGQFGFLILLVLLFTGMFEYLWIPIRAVMMAIVGILV